MRLLSAVEAIDRPGTFVARGVMATVLPGLEVEGIGSIGLPMSPAQASQLKQCCEQAAYGKGERTIVDTDVRRVWRLTPDRFTLANPAWPIVLRDVVAQVEHELGLEGQALQPHLYDLLLYDKGGFFLPHRDGEKRDRMVATLVIVLPSTFTGGELVVRHEGEERTIDFSGDDAQFQTQYAAFYADCEHEVKPLASGHRVCLVYNLTLSKAKKSIGAPRNRPAVQKIAKLLADWSAAGDGPLKIALTLEHQYTRDGLAWDMLKGIDRARARVLADAADIARCHAYLALLTFWESGSVEGGYDDYYSSRRRRYDDDDEAGEDDEDKNGGKYKMCEVFDSSLTADHWSSPDGTLPAFGALPIEEHEILPEDSLTGVKPEEDYEGYTGNAGMTLERWYRRAAILLWSDSGHFRVLCSGGAKQATAALSQMISTARQVEGNQAKMPKDRCRQFAATILEDWPVDTDAFRAWHDESDTQQTDAFDPLGALEFLDDPKLIRIYLRDLLRKDPTIEPGRLLTTIFARHGWETYRAELTELFQRTDRNTLGRNVRLLDRLCNAAADATDKTARSESRDTCLPLAGAAVAALIRIDAEPVGHGGFVRERARTLACLARSLLAIRADDFLARIATHIGMLSDRYSLQDVQMPALVEVGKFTQKQARPRSVALSRWMNDCRRRLESLTAAAPQPPDDFCREANVKCKCTDCAELNRFLADPTERQHRFQMRQSLRDHLESQIRTYHCDVDCTTDRRPRPQILICTKNVATHQRLLKAYHQNLKHLLTLGSLQEKD